MRVLVTGGRDFRNAVLMFDTLRHFRDELQPISRENLVIVHGDAAGADHFADACAQLLQIKTERHPADWRQYGKSAGPRRNQAMLDTGIDLVLAFPGGSGTRDMVRRAQIAGVEVEQAVPEVDL